MYKISNMPLELVIACKVYELQLEGVKVTEFFLTKLLQNHFPRFIIEAVIKDLVKFDVLQIRSGCLEITQESTDMVIENYELYWPNITAVLNPTL